MRLVGATTLLSVFLSHFCVSVAAEELRPGPLVSYTPFYADKWSQRAPIEFFPWEGKKIVVLTLTKDFDPAIMANFVRKLDAGWDVYAQLMPREPSEFKRINGKVPIVMAPTPEQLDGAFGRGALGQTGVEVTGFTRVNKDWEGQYDLLQRVPHALFHVYYYEMGRNWYVFGERHSLFYTGFSVFMRNVCMDHIPGKDAEPACRAAIDQAEAAYARSRQSFVETFTLLDGPGSGELYDEKGNRRDCMDSNCQYASVMLRLRRENGGDAWVKRFYEHLLSCPEGKATKADEVGVQVLNWVICASLAAGKDLTPMFRDRWRFPLSPQTWKALQAFNWAKKGQTVEDVFDVLPPDQLPTEVALARPAFLTADRRRRNLLAEGKFEDEPGNDWSVRSFRGDDKAARRARADSKEGKYSLTIRSAHPGGDDISYVRKVSVTPNTRYLLAGWARTKDVTVTQEGGAVGANLSIYGGWERSEPLLGNTDWTYLVLVFDSGKRSEIEVAARLGFYNSTAKGSAWFDDLVMIELE